MRRLGLLIALALSIALLAGAGDGSYGGGSYKVASGSYLSSSPSGASAFSWAKTKVVITLDDGYVAQDTLRAVLDSLGVHCTLYLSWHDYEYNSGYLQKADVDEFYAGGHDVGFTGMQHRSAEGGVLAFSDPDSIAWQVSPDSLIAEFSASPGYHAPVSFGVDVGKTSYEAALAVQAAGYTSMRGGYIGTDGQGADFVGSPRWDKLYRWADPTKVSMLYGFGCVDTEDAVASWDASAIFYSDAWTPPDTIQANVDRVFAESAANGNAPIVLIFHNSIYRDNDFPAFYEYVNANYSVDWVTAAELAQMMRSNLEFRDAPMWAPYAQIESVAASDEIFVGPAAPVYADSADVYLVSNSTTAVDSTDYAHQISYGHTYASAIASSPATAIGSGDLLYADLGELPLSGGEDLGLIYFNLTPLVDKDIISATLHWCNSSTAVNQTNDDEEFFGPIGVTVEAFIAAMKDSTSVSYNMLNGLSALSGYTWPTHFGEYMRPLRSAASSMFYSSDFTEFVRDRIAAGDSGVAFGFQGQHVSDSLDQWRVYTHDYGAGAGQPYRPYMVVKTSD